MNAEHKYRYEVIEDNGGGLHLYVFWGGKVIYATTGYEHRQGELIQDLVTLHDGTDFNRWESNVAEPQAAYDNITSHVFGWKLVANGEKGKGKLYKGNMGRAAQLEFRVTDEECDLAQSAAWLGRKGGSSKSERKQAASRANGRKGGRPKKADAQLKAIIESESALRDLFSGKDPE